MSKFKLYKKEEYIAFSIMFSDVDGNLFPKKKIIVFINLPVTILRLIDLKNLRLVISQKIGSWKN